ncbi:carbohydrate ABC transporter permease [Salinispira pacifica]
MKQKGWRIASTTIVLILVAAFLVPVVWTIETSLKTRVDAWSMPPKWTFVPSIANYVRALFQHHFLTYLRHSAIIAAGSTILAVAFGGLAAYAFERFRFRGKQVLFFGFLFVYMLPEMSIALPTYLIGVKLGLLDTYPLLIIMHASFTTAFSTWMLRGFVAEVPEHVEESAMVDGCTRITAFFRIVLPLMAPGMVATAIFCLIFSWNDLPYALVLSSLHTETLPVAIGQLKTPAGTAWGEIMAVTVVAFLPTVIVAFLAQRWLVRGLTFGATR